MDYIKQLEAFYSTLDYNSLSVNAIAIYQYLLHIAFKTGWSEEFKVANITIQSKLNLSIKQLQTARNELILKNYISYKKGDNQKNSPKYRIISLYETPKKEIGQPQGYTERQAKGIAQGQPQEQAEGYIITILYLYFNFIINKEQQKFKNITAKDKQSIINILIRLGIYIKNTEILDYMSEQEILDLKVQYWVIKEIYFSPYKVFLNQLTRERLNFRFLKTKKYVDMNTNMNKFLNYFIKSLQEDFYKNKKEEG